MSRLGFLAVGLVWLAVMFVLGRSEDPGYEQSRKILGQQLEVLENQMLTYAKMGRDFEAARYDSLAAYCENLLRQDNQTLAVFLPAIRMKTDRWFAISDSLSAGVSVDYDPRGDAVAALPLLPVPR